MIFFSTFPECFEVIMRNIATEYETYVLRCLTHTRAGRVNCFLQDIGRQELGPGSGVLSCLGFPCRRHLVLRKDLQI